VKKWDLGYAVTVLSLVAEAILEIIENFAMLLGIKRFRLLLLFNIWFNADTLAKAARIMTDFISKCSD
jgi:hypothetical protein